MADQPYPSAASRGAGLRAATPADLEVVLSLAREFCAHFEYAWSDDVKRAAVESVLADPSLGRIHLIQSEGEEVAGYLFLSFYFSLEYGGRTAFVDELFVRPEHRGAGLGSDALRSVLGVARELGLTAVHLEAERTNPRAAALYVRLGFVDYDRTLLTLRL
jgi:GNAT superfamily N-acetyltransferase